MRGYEFSNQWFEVGAKKIWDELIPLINPRTALEVGSYEGASACYLIDKLAPNLTLHCIDTWAGSSEHINGSHADTDGINMGEVERRFFSNINKAIAPHLDAISIHIHKGESALELSKLLAGGLDEYFDFIYIDGSHVACDVLLDAVLSFKLLKVGGVMVFDDYFWWEPSPHGKDILRCPKLAIDCFTNIFANKIEMCRAVSTQSIIQKLSN